MIAPASPPDDGPFATLAAQEIADELAAERIAAARWRAPERERAEQQREKNEQRAALAAQVNALECDRVLSAQLPRRLYTAVRYVEATLYDGPMRSSDLDAGRGDISWRTLRRARLAEGIGAPCGRAARRRVVRAAGSGCQNRPPRRLLSEGKYRHPTTAPGGIFNDRSHHHRSRKRDRGSTR